MDEFARQALTWYDAHGRRNLPWHIDRSPYRIWISEVMLQQTQVAIVIPYFQRFIARFPNVFALARADLDDVLALWTGLGYYARGRNLHAAAIAIADRHAGELPADLDALIELPGIGRSTAGAILASAFAVRAPILDGNVKRLLARFHAVEGYPGTTATSKQLWQHADAHTPSTRVADYTQAVMDLGAMVCTRTKPSCETCPLRDDCEALRTDTVSRFPQPRPRRTLPIKRTRMWLFTDERGRCLLEKRPPSGIWGGLWGPIEQTTEAPIDDVLATLGLQLEGDLMPLDGFRHTFTHFHLDVHPLRVPVARSNTTIADSDRYRWYGPGDNQPIGLSRVAERLLAMIRA